MHTIIDKLNFLNAHSANQNAVFSPEFYRIYNPEERLRFELLLEKPGIVVFDYLFGTLQEFIKTQNPSVKYTEQQLQSEALAHISPLTIEEYGVWVYYPWSNRLVHILDEAEYVRVRTSRNQYKITHEEQAALGQKKIGVIGLSVGQSVSLTLCMERICGEIRLADFDTLELTNLNRIRTGVHNLGLPKVYSVAREIAEIDPFIKIKCFVNGINDNNMDDFFTAGGKLDLMIEESDGFDIKILSRHKAKSLQIPVLMEASDKCMVDVERFDLEPDRPILHGLVKHLNLETLKSLKTTEEKIPYMLDILGLDTSSLRLKASMLEIEQSINTWPQLASAVTMGGGITADVARRLLLGSYSDSGRYYVDIEEIIGNKVKTEPPLTSKNSVIEFECDPLSPDAMDEMVNQIAHTSDNSCKLTEHQIKLWVGKAILAPSVGNNQPWMWYSKNNVLYLFHDKSKSISWVDPFDNLANLGLGASIENLKIAAHKDGYLTKISYLPIDANSPLRAKITFEDTKSQNNSDLDLFEALTFRCSNRQKGSKQPIEKEILKKIEDSVSNYGCVDFVENPDLINELADIVASVEKIRFMNPTGHYEFFKKELRWTKDEVISTRDGLDIETLELSNTERVAMKVASEKPVMDTVREWKGGNGFKKISLETIKSASAVALLRLNSTIEPGPLLGGQALQRVWLTANQNHVSFHPISAPVFFFDWIKTVNDFSPEIIEELRYLEQRFNKIFIPKDNLRNTFLFKLAISKAPTQIALRRELDKSLIFRN